MSAAPLTAAGRPLTPVAVALMLVLCSSWALNQIAIKLALPDLPPFTQATLRSVFGLIVLVSVARLRGVPLFEKDGTLRAGLLAGLLFGVEFVLVYRGLVLTSASRAVVFLYTAPFFVALGARRFLGEWLGAAQWSGLALCFLGVMLAIGVPQSDVSPSVLLGDLMVVGGGALWAATTLVVKATPLLRAPPEKALGYQVAVSIPILAIAAFLAGERVAHAPGALTVAVMAYQSIWVVGCTFLIWFTLVKTFSASKLSAFTFITPLLGVVAGVLVMGDRPSPIFGFAALLVAIGLYVVNRPGKPPIDPLLRPAKI